MKQEATIQTRKKPQTQINLREVLLVCGILAPLLFVGTDILAGTLYPGYNFISRSISELSAIGAPTRPLVLTLNLTADVLMIAFGVVVWLLAGPKRSLRIMAGLIVGNAVVSLVASVFFPMHLGEAASASSNIMGVILGAVSVVFFLLAIGFGAAAYRNWFRFYSIGILLAFLVLAILRLSGALGVPAGQSVSLVGVQERTMVYNYLLWVLVLAITLLQTKEGQEATPVALPDRGSEERAAS
ncbi:MAG TPA: DUF998 domain-containing protein [Anaerolineae bacterium]|jgi:hypothetical protein|nr:DUF998 domain-containing protein [Anaerolineae bacterium]